MGFVDGFWVFFGVSARFWGFFAWLGLGFRFPGGPSGFFAVWGVSWWGFGGRFVGGFRCAFRLCFAGFWGVCWGCRGVLVGFGVFGGVLGCFLVGFWGQGFRFWGFFAWLGLGFRIPGGPSGFFCWFLGVFFGGVLGCLLVGFWGQVCWWVSVCVSGCVLLGFGVFVGVVVGFGWVLGFFGGFSWVLGGFCLLGFRV